MGVFEIIFNIVFYIFIFLIATVLGLYQVNSLVLILFLVIMVGFRLFVEFYPLVLSRDINRIEKYLVKKKHGKRRQPLLFFYAVANQMDNEVEEVYHKLISKTKNPHKKSAFNTVYALYKNDLEMAKNNVQLLKQETYRVYYKALILIEENELNEAKNLGSQIKSESLKDIIQAEIFLKENNMEKVKEHYEKALRSSKGLGYYSVYKRYISIVDSKK